MQCLWRRWQPCILLASPTSARKDFNPQSKLVLIYRPRKGERLSWPEQMWVNNLPKVITRQPSDTTGIRTWATRSWNRCANHSATIWYNQMSSCNTASTCNSVDFETYMASDLLTQTLYHAKIWWILFFKWFLAVSWRTKRHYKLYLRRLITFMYSRSFILLILQLSLYLYVTYYQVRFFRINKLPMGVYKTAIRFNGKSINCPWDV